MAIKHLTGNDSNRDEVPAGGVKAVSDQGRPLILCTTSVPTHYPPWRAPRVQGVVQRELGGKDGVVVGVDETEALGDGLEPPRLGHRIEVGRDIGAVDDLRQPGQRRVTLEQPVLLDDRLEAAASVAMSELGALGVERSGPSRSATASTSLADTKINSASGSMYLRMSHGQAARSTLTCSRVTHFMLCSSLGSV